VNLAGEPLPGVLVQQLYRQGTVERVYNLYGPSEDTTYSTWARTAPEEETPTIGRPIANTQVYLLDRHLNPVPLGVVGELHLGGEGLARGYLNKPELTAERFVRNPFSNQPGARLYKTGDLARYLPDGRIAYIGRVDQQVKIRGYRIELGEIETTLNRHPAVKDSVVVVHEDPTAGKRLITWLVYAQQPHPTPGELRTFLQRTLPQYMLPAGYHALDQVPLTPNGKIDRRALLDVDVSATDLVAKELVLPRDPVEEVLADIWREVLGTPRIGVHDDFFELGGHSLLATQVVSRTRERFRIELPFRSIFESPTVEGLAQQVREATEARIGEPPSQIVSRPRVRHKLAPPS